MADEISAEDMQRKLAESGAERVDRLVYKTNQGTVILASPQDMKRIKLQNRAQRFIDRARRYSMPAPSLDLPPGFKSEDE